MARWRFGVLGRLSITGFPGISSGLILVARIPRSTHWSDGEGFRLRYPSNQHNISVFGTLAFTA